MSCAVILYCLSKALVCSNTHTSCALMETYRMIFVHAGNQVVQREDSISHEQ